MIGLALARPLHGARPASARLVKVSTTLRSGGRAGRAALAGRLSLKKIAIRMGQIRTKGGEEESNERQLSISNTSSHESTNVGMY